jgi:hypothetical protein
MINDPPATLSRCEWILHGFSYLSQKARCEDDGNSAYDNAVCDDLIGLSGDRKLVPSTASWDDPNGSLSDFRNVRGRSDADKGVISRSSCAEMLELMQRRSADDVARIASATAVTVVPAIVTAKELSMSPPEATAGAAAAVSVTVKATLLQAGQDRFSATGIGLQAHVGSHRATSLVHIALVFCLVISMGDRWVVTSSTSRYRITDGQLGSQPGLAV